MKGQLHFYVKIDAWGRPKGFDAERMKTEMRNHFGGSFVRITVEGWEQTPEQMRKWYFSGIIPAILQEMRVQGNPVHPKSGDDKGWLHKELKEMFIPPQVDEHNRPIVVHGQQVHTTKDLGAGGWHRYIADIQEWTYQNFGIELNPEKKPKRN